jgi:outer membrane lipoprotein-sorting protein
MGMSLVGSRNALYVPTLVLIFLLILPGAAIAAPGPTFKGDPQAVAEVQAAFQKFATARSWRARMTSSGVTTTTEFVAPDRFRMVTTQDNQTTEIFLIGREMWTKSGGTCQKLPAAVPVANPKELAEQTGADTTITVTKAGPESVEGTPTQTYQLVVETRGNTARQKLYVATATGLPRRIEIQSPQGTVAVDYFDYNAAITINNPPC